MTTINRDTACEPLWALLKDVPTCGDRSLWKGLKSTIQGIESRVRTRGLTILLVSLPAAGKVYDKALSEGRLYIHLLPDELTFGGEITFFRDLFDKVFDLENLDPTGAHPIRREVDPMWVFFTRCFLNLYKKLEVACPQENVRQEVEEFYTNDATLREPSLHWNADAIFFASSMQIRDRLSFSDILDFDRDSCSARRVSDVLQRVCDIVVSKLPILNPEDVKPKHGPNAVADLSGRLDKYIFPNWPKKLEWVFPIEYFAYSTEEWAGSDSQTRESRDDVQGRLIAVPKTYSAPRLITVEPTSHQYLQQGLLRWLRDNFPWPLQHCINFHSQEPSRFAAKEASNGNGMSTVDLKSASDRLSCWTVERAFRKSPSLLCALYATRTYVVRDDTKSGVFPSPFYLKKFAGQGSAVTFPVQSMIYALCSIAAVIVENRWECSEKNILRATKLVRVFGDDIIIPSTALTSLSLIFNILQLKINVGKSHTQGSFRESCGGDYFQGIDVKPLYLRSLAQTTRASVVASHVDVSNNAYAMGLWNLSEYISMLIPQGLRKFIPISTIPQPCLTWRTFMLGYVSDTLRYNNTLHRYETKGLCVHSKQGRTQREGPRELLDFFLRRNQDTATIEHPWSAGFSVVGRQSLSVKWAPVI